MKKLAIAAAVAAVAAGGYWFSQQQGASGASSNHTAAVLASVPADTPFFSGNLKPFPLKNYLQATASWNQGKVNQQDIEEWLADNPELKDSAGARFGFYVLNQYLSNLDKPEQLLKVFGLPDQGVGFFYTLGALPVFRVELADATAFWALLDAAEKDSGFSHSAQKLGEQDYRAYRLVSGSKAEDNLDLVIAEKDGLLTVTFNMTVLPPELLSLAFGATKAEKPLTEAELNASLIKPHGLTDGYVGYINHQELVKAFVSGDNQLGKQLTDLISRVDADRAERSKAMQEQFAAAQAEADAAEAAAGKDISNELSSDDDFADEMSEDLQALEDSQDFSDEELDVAFSESFGESLAPWQTPECQQELNAIAANWPRTVFGFSKLEVTDKSVMMNVRTIIESNNQVVLGALGKMKGTIPSYAQDSNQIASFGIGLDVGALTPALTEIWTDLLQPSYQCPQLAEAQAGLQELNPALLGMFTGMADGVKGIAASLVNLDVATKDGELDVKQADALVTLSAENPIAIFNMSKMMDPSLASINLVEGQDVSLKELLPIDFNIDPQLGVRGKHLVIYNGENAKSLADKLKDEALTANGLYQFDIDYTRIFKPLVEVMQSEGEELPAEFAELQNYNMQLGVSLNISDKGVIIDTDMQTK